MIRACSSYQLFLGEELVLADLESHFPIPISKAYDGVKTSCRYIYARLLMHCTVQIILYSGTAEG